AVLISGATVLVAMAGMLFAGSGVFTSIGTGAMIVVFVSMIGSLTVLPALLSKLGDRIDRGVLSVGAATVGLAFRRREPRLVERLRERRTLIQRAKSSRTESRLWSLLLQPALRFPAAAAVLSAAFLVALSLPVFGMHTKLIGLNDLPHSLKIVRTYEAIQRAFPGASSPATVVVKAPDVSAPRVVAFVLGLAFVLRLVTFRSLVIPLEAIVLNLLSVGAAYGVLVWIFQDGHLQGVLGYRSNGAVVTWLPLFLFTVLFGLSMD